MALTASFYAGDTDKLWKTYQVSGTHTGTPANGEEVQVWQDEATPATRDQIFVYGTTRPRFRSPGSMALPALEFSGSSAWMESYNNTGETVRTFGTYFTNALFTIVAAIRLTDGGTNNAGIYDNTAVLADSGGYFGIHIKTISSVHYLYLYNYDSNEDVTTGIAVTLNTDYVIVATHGGGTLSLKVISGAGGGTSATQTVSSGNTANTGHSLRLGRNYGSVYAAFFIGEVNLYNSNEGLTGAHVDDVVTRWLPAGSSTEEADLTLALTQAVTIVGAKDVPAAFTLATLDSVSLAAAADFAASLGLGQACGAAFDCFNAAARELALAVSQAVSIDGGLATDADVSLGLTQAAATEGENAVFATVELTHSEAAGFAAMASGVAGVTVAGGFALVIAADALRLAGISLSDVLSITLAGSEATVIVTPCCRTVRVRVEVRTVAVGPSRVVVRAENRTSKPPCDC